MPPQENQDSFSDSTSSLETPWPQMGVLSDSAHRRAHSGPSIGVLSSSSENEPTADTPHAAPTLNHTIPAHPTQVPSSPYAPPQGTAMPAPGRSRTQRRPAWIVLGLIFSFILAPLSMIVYVTVATDLVGLSSRMAPVSVNQHIEVDASGGFFLMALGGGTADGCALTDSAGGVHQLEAIPGTQPAWWANNLTQGSYTLNCDVQGSPMLMATSGVSPESISTHAHYGMLIATAVGLSGMAMFVLGIRRRIPR